jgi:hypothetical protein
MIICRYITKLYGIWNSHRFGYEDFCFLRCNVGYCWKSTSVSNKISTPSSGSDQTLLTNCFIMVSCLTYSSSLMMDPSYYSEMPIRFNAQHCVVPQQSELFIWDAMNRKGGWKGNPLLWHSSQLSYAVEASERGLDNSWRHEMCRYYRITATLIQQIP